MSLSIRLGLFYAAIFSVIGVQLPFWPLYLSSKGLNAEEIGMVLAASFAVKLLTNPLVGAVVDRRGDRRRPLLVLSLIGLLSTALYAPAQGFPLVLAVTLLSAAAISAALPLSDSLTMACAVSHRLDYGRVRLWGSLSFIATASLAGWTLVAAPRPAILAACLAGQLLTLAAVWQLPDLRSPPPPRGIHPPLTLLLKNRVFLLFLATSSLTQASHVIYYGFATLHWRAAGLSGGLIGGLWAEGVIAEVILFASGARLIHRFGPMPLLASAGLAGLLRWTVLALTTDPWLLASVQFLHAFTFAANHLAAMHFINRTAPPGLSARAQGIYASVTNGLAQGLGMLAAGWLYQSLGGLAFLAMSLLSGAGLLLSLRLAGEKGEAAAGTGRS